MKSIIIFIVSLAIVACYHSEKSEKKENKINEKIVIPNPSPTLSPTPVPTSIASPTPTTSPSPTPTDIPDQNEEIKVTYCDFSDTDKCELPNNAKIRLKNLSTSADNMVPVEFLGIESVKTNYKLNDTQINCLRDNYCKEYVF